MVLGAGCSIFVVSNQRELIIGQVYLKAISDLLKADFLSRSTRMKCSVWVSENTYSKLHQGVNVTSSSEALPTAWLW